MLYSKNYAREWQIQGGSGLLYTLTAKMTAPASLNKRLRLRLIQLW